MNFVKEPKVERLHKSGFSLIELLVVVSIIVILAGITINVMSSVNRKRDASTTSKNILMVRTKLEAFYNEQGYYPVGQDATSACVYKALSGDPTGQGANPTGTIYWPELNDDRNPRRPWCWTGRGSRVPEIGSLGQGIAGRASAGHL